MLSEQQQRILGYFIEEARDHLNTIEQGLLNLQNTLNDPEMINEVFRAAHSIKGGAAMLGLASIQRTAHRLEDCFKVLKENPIQVDQKLESLFLGVSDTLKALLEHLSGPFGLTEETANTLMSETEPVFGWLHEHLEALVVQQGGSFEKESSQSQITSPPLSVQPQFTHEQLQTQVMQTLRDMLQIFKQPATPENRQQLEGYCDRLVESGTKLNLTNWCNLCRGAGSAVINPEHSYLNLAKIIITEIKQAIELVMDQRDGDIAISPQLAALIEVPEIELLELDTDLFSATNDAEHLAVVDENTSENVEIHDIFANSHDDEHSDEINSLIELNIEEYSQQTGDSKEELEELEKLKQEEDSFTDNDEINSLLELDSLESHEAGQKVADSSFVTGIGEYENVNNIPVDLALTDTVEDLSQVSERLLKDDRSNLDDSFDDSSTEDVVAVLDTDGPEVGIEELTELDELFKDDAPELDETWSNQDVGSESSGGVQATSHHQADHSIDSEVHDLLQLEDITSIRAREVINAEELTVVQLFGNFLDDDLDVTEDTEVTEDNSDRAVLDHLDNREDDHVENQLEQTDGHEMTVLFPLSDQNYDENEEIQENGRDRDNTRSEPELDLIATENNPLAMDEQEGELDSLFVADTPVGVENISDNSDAEFDQFWSTSLEVDQGNNLDSLELQIDGNADNHDNNDNDIAKALEASLFAVAGDKQPPQQSSELVANDDFDHNFELSHDELDLDDALEADLSVSLTDNLEDNLEINLEDNLLDVFEGETDADDIFAQLTPTTNTANLNEDGSSFDQSPETLEFVPEFTHSHTFVQSEPVQSEPSNLDTSEGITEENAIADKLETQIENTSLPTTTQDFGSELDLSPLSDISLDESLDIDSAIDTATNSFTTDFTTDPQRDRQPSLEQDISIDESFALELDNVDVDINIAHVDANPFAVDAFADEHSVDQIDELYGLSESEDHIFDFADSLGEDLTSTNQNLLSDLSANSSEFTTSTQVGETSEVTEIQAEENLFSEDDLTATTDLQTHLQQTNIQSFDANLNQDPLTDILNRETDLLDDAIDDANPAENISPPLDGLDSLDKVNTLESLDTDDDSEFIALEEMLSFDAATNTPPVTPEINTTPTIQDSTQQTTAATPVEKVEAAEEAEEEDPFAHLDALLESKLDSKLGANTESNQGNDAVLDSEFAALEQLLEAPPAPPSPLISSTPHSSPTPPPTPAKNSLNDEFSELERMLVDADQLMSPSSPANVTKPQRTPPRRAVRFEQLMKVPVKHLDDLSNLVGELVVNRNTLEQDQERMRQSLDNLLHQVQQLSDVGARMQELYERSLLEASLLASRGQGFGYRFGNDRQSSEEVGDRGFSELEMDRFTPFHTLSQEMIELIVRVRESASDIDFVTEETERVARQFRQVTTQLQEGLTRARMVPFSQVTDRVRRGVRDNAIKCGKQVDLQIEGQDTLIDKMILEHLTDPLTHMLNNAIAHGIETPPERKAKGKSETGTITVRAFHQGNQTVISVADDGAGIDPEKVKLKALQVGLISPDQAKTISRIEVYDLLFQSGFSTKDQADDLAGRGVGMDVVRTSISEIRGAISTDSRIDQGTSFTIRLPLTLSICKALCCVSDRARIAFPMDGVEDTLDISAKQIHQGENDQQYIIWRDTQLPFKPLKDLLTLNRQLSRGNVYGGNRDDDMISVVVVRSGNTMLALQVDLVLSEQEIVIKQFEGPAPKPIGVAGATVLGDGRIMAIADVLEIIDIFQGRTSKQSSISWEPPSTNTSDNTGGKIDPTVLIVDDSITVRELLSLTFSKAGYRVEQARDGQEAWDKLRSGLPCDIVFCDIEMPRCDGLELLSRIQKESTLNHLPIAMLTSRGADKHRQMAISLGASGYFTKPYLEEALLEAASRMLKGENLVSGG